MRIVEDKLANGIRVVTAERPESAAVAFHIYFGCGGRHERDEVVGVSHALEHMVFKGTPSRTTLDIAREMEGNGAAVNANTAPERTCYHFTAPADAFAAVLEIYADAVNSCLLDKEEWDRERLVILEELKMYEDMPRIWVSDMLETTVYNPQMGVLGNRETINAIEPEHMRELIEKWYVPGNTVISVAGGVEREEVMALSERYFGDRTGGGEKPASPALPQESAAKVVAQARQTDQVNLALGFRAFGLDREDGAPLRVMCNILGGKMSSRLFTEVREKRGLAYSVGAAPHRYTDTGMIELKAGVALEKAVEATEVMLSETGKFKTEPVSAQELEEAKRHIKGNLQIRESSEYHAGRNGSNLMLRGRIYPVEEELADIDAVREQDVRRVAEEVFQEDRLTGAVIAEKELGDEIEAALKI